LEQDTVAEVTALPINIINHQLKQVILRYTLHFNGMVDGVQWQEGNENRPYPA